MGSESTDKRVLQTVKVMEIILSWGLSASEQADLLAIPGGARARQMRKYTDGITAFPEHPDVDERMDHILGISDALRTSFPLNQAMGSFWMKHTSKKFPKKAPLDHILDDGLAGLLAVRIHLDCAYDWHLDASSSKK